MAGKPSSKAEAWAIFDHIVAEAAPKGEHSNPWVRLEDGSLRFEPDYFVLERLLGVPLHLKAATQSGVPALALDVWLSYEFRRAGFDADQVWPRSSHPRVLPPAVAALTRSLPAKLRTLVADRIATTSSIPGVTTSSGNILGKNYIKQVDVIMTDWSTGPELLVSTKRMDSSYGKNAPNRVEESYGDAKNLRLRHPLAALGFVFGLRSDILQKEAATAEWIFDLLVKLGLEDDAYHATCLILMEYGDDVALPAGEAEPANPGILEPGPDDSDVEEDLPSAVPDPTVLEAVKHIPKVRILQDKTPDDLAPGRFLGAMVTRVLGATPVTMHKEARRRRASPASPLPVT